MGEVRSRHTPLHDTDKKDVLSSARQGQGGGPVLHHALLELLKEGIEFRTHGGGCLRDGRRRRHLVAFFLVGGKAGFPVGLGVWKERGDGLGVWEWVDGEEDGGGLCRRDARHGTGGCPRHAHDAGRGGNAREGWARAK